MTFQVLKAIAMSFCYSIPLVFVCVFSCATPVTKFPVSDHYDGKEFRNEDPMSNELPDLFPILKWQLFGSRSKSWPDWVDDNLKPNFSSKIGSEAAAVTSVNHASDFIQLEHLTVLTDPVFSERVGPFSWIGPKRHRKPGALLTELPKIDVVVISHNHYDHMDLQSLSDIQKRDQPVFIVPLGNRRHFSEIDNAKVVELDWWQSVPIRESKITLVPMQHWSTRTFFDRREVLWGGYVIESDGVKVLFAGDTGYNVQFQEIYKKFGPIDLSLLPIGAYEPRWFMKNFHMNPEEAVLAHLDLKSEMSVAMHFGTFRQSDEGIEDPVEDLKKAVAAHRIEANHFLAPKNGETVYFKKARSQLSASKREYSFVK